MADRPGAHGVALMLPTRNPKVAARVINGEAMILTPHDSQLHVLNPVATRIWELLPDHRTLEALTAAIVEEFEVEAPQASADIQDLMGAMLEREILVEA